MTRSGLVQLLSCILATVRTSSQGEKSEHIKQSLKKLPEGYVNPVTKEKGGPRSPETA
ncbi:unnamed protein product [Nyctereutes procyonoides]|uniref:(raccoon dog) hypothetical protein n=1 Tax=Nyctereutes procyonoides TaxID=34880 RepID=A0A811Z4F8_NYCPR|nr:unnamed protein product [Nyctereutes procyonoides]